ncbi:MAG: SDR family oxidoreductase [Micropruina sp.]|uniref:SDR family NAD(P)-dependent oxidoreductase n=1 Tax=Micropruina sp. TaxID=2737536 RepID=UPI0039E31298
MSFTRTALVTGASRGLGAVIARRLAADGWAVAVNYVSGAERAERVVDEIRAAGGVASGYAADVTDEDAVTELVARVGAELGPVLAVVANATGPQPEAFVEQLTWPAYLDQLRFFVKSPTLLTQAALPAMKRHRFGRVVLIGSDMVDRAKPGSSAYAAAKAAEAELVKIWARELGPHGVTVNLVAPGWIPVERHVGADTAAYLAEVPLGRMGTPDDVAALVGYLASDAAGFVTAQRISVNGGHTIG